MKKKIMNFIKRYNENINWDFDFEEENHNKWDELINLLDENNSLIIVDLHKDDIDKFDKIVSKYGKKRASAFYYKLFRNKPPYEDIGHIYIHSNILTQMPLPRGYDYDKEIYYNHKYLDLTK